MRIHGQVLLESKARLHWISGVKPEDRVMPKEAENLNNRYDARLEGILVCDRAANKLTRWDMAALGDYTGVWCGYRASDKLRQYAIQPIPIGFSFELDRTDYELPPERRRPASYQFNYVFKGREQNYWDPDRWLEDWKKQQKK
jgi:hypothetical protein